MVATCHSEAHQPFTYPRYLGTSWLQFGMADLYPSSQHHHQPAYTDIRPGSQFQYIVPLELAAECILHVCSLPLRHARLFGLIDGRIRVRFFRIHARTFNLWTSAFVVRVSSSLNRIHCNLPLGRAHDETRLRASSDSSPCHTVFSIY